MKFNSIQLFRGIAAVLVLLFHLERNCYAHLNYQPFNNVFTFGVIGVDFFFVLSGFIITYVHFADFTSDRPDKIKRFFSKRFIRIFPFYWVITLAVAFAYYFKTPDYMVQEGMKLNVHQPGTWVYIFKSLFLISDNLRGLIGASWTLSYEILFYVVFGVTLVLGFKWAKILASLWVVLILIFYFIPGLNNAYTLFYFNYQIIEFILGCIVAFIVLKGYKIPFKFSVPVLGIFLIIVFNKFHIQGLGFEFKNSLSSVISVAMFFAVLIYLCVIYELKYNAFKLPSFLILLGDASYAIYLTHNIFLSGLIRFYTKLNPDFKHTGYLDAVALVIFAVAVAIGILSHLLIEKPLLKYLRHKSLKPAVEN